MRGLALARDCLIRFGSDVCHDLSRALSKEWLETNGNGGYASSTIIGLNTRRYHGLLVGAYSPGLARTVLVAKLEEWVQLGDDRYPLSANQYPAVIHPEGHLNLHQFALDPYPKFEYRLGPSCLIKSVFAVPGANASVVRYQLAAAPQPVSLCVIPFLAVRDYHHLIEANPAANGRARLLPGRLGFRVYAGAPEVWMRYSSGRFQPGADWYRRLEYQRELERGLDFSEDLFAPGALEATLEPGAELELVLADFDPASVDTAAAERERVSRKSAFSGRTLARALGESCHHFLVRRPDGQASVVAGYHWFADWGRDTLVALPGLALGTGRYDFAREVLQTWLGAVDQGLVPNRFPEGGAQPDYNSVDATLWLFHAVDWYCRQTGDWAFGCETALPVLTDIIQWLTRGTRYDIRVEQDGLLRAGGPQWQLTWMDAKVGDWVVTPRQGKAVEVNALWYNALRVAQALARRARKADLATALAAQAKHAGASFPRVFWNQAQGMLYDCVDGESRDASVRPNQIFALSLRYPVLPRRYWRPVVQAVEGELLTRYGLRTLAASDERYHGHYRGPQPERDAAYHQGAVWPWLLGHFITAYVRAHGPTAEVRDRAARFLTRFCPHLEEAGLGSVSEIFEGDLPHAPVGCIAQAWSVAELLRALVEDVGAGRLRLRSKAAAAAAVDVETAGN
jgi:predicted glycogen debranching enzyme